MPTISNSMSHISLLIALALVFFERGSSFLVQSKVLSRAHHHAVNGNGAVSMKAGGHGEDFKFLPVLRTASDEFLPRILPIAGVYPDITPAQLLAPSPAPTATPGMWTYEFSDPNGPQLGTVALPGTEVIYNAIDPVVLITTNTQLGVRVVEEVEMLLVVDRADLELRADNFYVFQTPSNSLTVQWADDLPAGYTILGRVVICHVPFTSAMKPKSTGFLEDDGDDFD